MKEKQQTNECKDVLLLLNAIKIAGKNKIINKNNILCG